MYVIVLCFIFLFIFLSLLLIKNKKISSLQKELKNHTLTKEALLAHPLPIFLKNSDGKITNQSTTFNTNFGDYKQKAISQLSLLSKGKHSLKMLFDNGIEKDVDVYVNNTIGIIFDMNKVKKEQESLVRKKEHFELSLAGADEGCWEWDIPTDKIIFSKKSLELLEYKDDEEKPKSLSDWVNIVSSYDLAQVNEAFAQHIQGKSSHIFVKHRLKTSAQEKWLLIKGKALKHEDKQIKKVYGIITDITGSQRERENTSREKELFTNFMNSLPGLAFIKDKEGKYLYINTYYEQLLGFKEWKNKQVDDIFEAKLAQHIKNSDREAFYEGIQKHEEILANESGQKYIFQTYKFPMDTSNTKVLCGFGLDITKEKLFQERINLYANVFDHTSESILITDADIKIIAVNKAFCKTTGFSEKELIGKNPRIRKSGRHSDQFYENFWNELLKNGSWRGEIFNKNKDGSILPELMNVSTVKNKEGEILNFIAISQSIEKQKIIEESLRKKANFDVLTNLPNRSLFFDRLEHALRRNIRENEILALIFLDLDDFKIINDTHGHKIGDSVLKEVAKRLLLCIRDTDTIGRLGGDEFVIILESIRHLSDINFVAEKIIEEIKKPININSITCNIGVSLGISVAPVHTKNLKELLDFADQAMYKAKKRGKNCYILHQ